MSPNLTFQNGLSYQGHKSSQKGVWAIAIDDRCLSTCVPVSVSQAAPPLLCLRESISIYNITYPSGPRVFTKIICVIVGCLRMQNVRLAVYLDDWIFWNIIKNVSLQDKKTALNFPARLGFWQIQKNHSCSEHNIGGIYSIWERVLSYHLQTEFRKFSLQ